MLTNDEYKGFWFSLASELKTDIGSLQQFVAGQPLDKGTASSLRRLLEPSQEGKELSVANVIKKKLNVTKLTDLINSVLGDGDEGSRRQDAKRLIEFLTPLQIDAGSQFAAWLLR